MDQLPDTRHSLLLQLAEPANQSAWKDFVRLYEPVILRMAMKKGLQLSDAQDLCQEVLTRVARTAETWSPDRDRGTFRGWLSQVVRNLAIDHFRRTSRRPIMPGDSFVRDNADATNGSTEEQLFDHEERKQIFFRAAEVARDSFTDKTWLAFWQTCVEHQSPQFAAQQIGISIGAVYIARSRVIKKIRTIVEQLDSETGIWRTGHAN
ncbi:MAG: sigma-70 family RNA polymerase sigma factor [Pirellulaceae bacterium]